MLHANDEFRYASGEIANIGDVIEATIYPSHPLERKATGQVLDVVDGSVDMIIQPPRPFVQTHSGFAEVKVYALRCAAAHLVRRGRLDAEDPVTALLIREKREHDPHYDPFPNIQPG